MSAVTGNSPSEFKAVQALEDQIGDVVDPAGFIVSIPLAPCSICLDFLTREASSDGRPRYQGG